MLNYAYFYSIIWSDISTDHIVAVKWRIATSNKWMNQLRIHVAFSVDQKLQVSENVKKERNLGIKTQWTKTHNSVKLE